AVVADEMMREEVRIDQQRDQAGHPVRRVVFDTYLQQAPGLDDVTADRRVHEAGKQRYAEELGVGEILVAPRADRVGGLEYFEREAHEVKQRYSLYLVPGFQLCPQHPGLDAERDDEQRVVARQAEKPRARYREHC